MNALNEVNKILQNLSPIHRSPMNNRTDDNDRLTPEKFIVKFSLPRKKQLHGIFLIILGMDS